MTTESKVSPRKKTVYVLRTRESDDQPWSDPAYFRSKARRDKAGAVCRIIGGTRTHSFEEKKTPDEIQQIDFEP